MLKFVKCLLITLTLAVISATALAQAISPAMLEQFKMLPRAEQERLARQYGIEPSMLQQASSSNTLVDKNSQPQQLNQPRREVEAMAEFGQRKKQDKGPVRFGMRLFDAEISTFAPVSVMPVPDNYILSVDDELQIQLYGKQSSELMLSVSRDGKIFIPEVGPISVGGLSFNQARALIAERVRGTILGTEAAVSMGPLRTINIFVVGEAKYPGAYAVSALTTVTQALFVAGGVTDIGSLRQITVKRAGKTVSEFDLYDLLIRGDSRSDIHLQNGDVVFVAPLQAMAEVKGEVNRPALYEIKTTETISDLLLMAGGAKAGAYPRSAVLERFTDSMRNMQNLDLTDQTVKQIKLQAGDVLRIDPASAQVQNQIILAGAAARPGFYAWHSGIRISNLIKNHWADLLPTADLDYALVVREAIPGTITDIMHFNVSEALTSSGSVSDIELSPRDKVLLFNYANQSFDRQKLNNYLRKTLQQKLEDHSEQRWLMDDLSVDALKKVMESEKEPSLIAVNQNVEAEAETLQPSKAEQQQLITAELKQLFKGMFLSQEMLALTPHLTRTELLYPLLTQIKLQTRIDNNLALVSVAGAVRVPGEYPLSANAKVADLVNAAGGLNDATYVSRAELSRTLRQDGSVDGIIVSHHSINLQQALAGREDNVVLQNRDRLNIFATPGWKDKREVVIEGEVRFPGTYIIQHGETLSQVIARAGGVSDSAFVFGSVYTRQQVKEKEVVQYAKLVEQLKADVATRALSAASAQISPTDAMTMISELEKIEPPGRLVINLEQVIAGNPAFDLAVENGDRLFVPRKNRAVTIVGEVQHAGTHRFDDKLSLREYLSLAGGLRKRADGDRTYVIRADGSVMVPKTGWFAVSSDQLKPGDTIIVPLDTEYKDSLSLWAQVTQIFYQSAVAIAALNSF